MNPLGFFFGFSGRFRRSDYWLHVLVAMGIWAAFYFLELSHLRDLAAAQNAQPHQKAPPEFIWFLIIFLVFAVAMLVAAFSSMVRRFHDFGRSGWNWLWLLVPVVNIYFGLKLGFFRGDLGDNAYGASPYNKEKTL